jgi:chemotaxis-related protein WspD
MTMASPRPERCWRIIGTSGDRSCGELSSYTHCHNCPVFSSAGRQLMEAEPPAGYIEQWTHFLADARTRKGARTLSALVFRLGLEWVGLDTASVVEISDLRPSRRVAHRSEGTLQGIVNIRGNLLLQVDLFHLLKIERATPIATQEFPQALRENRNVAAMGSSANKHVAIPDSFSVGASKTRIASPPRLVVISLGGVTWVFQADEVLGVQRFSSAEIGPVPVTIAHRVARVTKGLLTLGQHKVGFVDSDVLFAQLRQAVG